MSTDDQSHAHHDTEVPYFLPSVVNASEWERLDEMHKGVGTYFGHQLSLANITSDVKQILEIGSGSGAWAIQAAQTYPDSTVTAVDIAPLPPRPLPKNVIFQKMDVTKGIPFEPETFDIIHARLVLVHVAHWETVLERMIALLKPGGWILVEDIDNVYFNDGPGGVGPATKRLHELLYVYYSPKSVVPIVGSRVGPILEETKLFSNLNVNEIRYLLNGKSDDPNMGVIAQTLSESYRKAIYSIVDKIVPKEAADDFWREVDNPRNNIYMKFHIVWAQKST